MRAPSTLRRGAPADHERTTVSKRLLSTKRLLYFGLLMSTEPEIQLVTCASPALEKPGAAYKMRTDVFLMLYGLLVATSVAQPLFRLANFPFVVMSMTAHPTSPNSLPGPHSQAYQPS